MNFDDDDEADFSLDPQNSSKKLASLFKSNIDVSTASNESLKYKAPKQPQAAAQPTQSSQPSQTTPSVMFFSGVQAFKYLNNKYEQQGKLGLALLSSSVNNQTLYRILLYVNKQQPLASIRVGVDFKVAVQKNNYISFYDESRQLWSILFDSEDLVVNFGTQIVLCKCNLLQGNLDKNMKLIQDLRAHDNDSNQTIESNDSVEVATIVKLWKDMKLTEKLEDTTQKPSKLRLGKNKLPQIIEDSIVSMKTGDRRLFALNSNLLQPHFSSHPNSVIFYDIQILRIKKNAKEERSDSNPLQQDSVLLDQLSTSDLSNIEPSRSRSESLKEKTKVINDQLNDPKLEKAKLISRMAKMGQQMLPSAVTIADDEWDAKSTIVESNDLASSLSQPVINNMVNTPVNNPLDASFQHQQQLFSQQQEQLIRPVPTINSNMPINSQLAIYRTAQPVHQAGYIYQQQPQQNLMSPYVNQQYQPMQSPVVQTQTLQQYPNESSELIKKLDNINEKLDVIKQSSITQRNNLPNMETSILLQNIQRIVNENEQYKKDLYEKSNKIDEQNLKITELLIKAQNYVEQSHQILEQKNNSFQSNAEKNVQRVLELEQDKMNLTSELSKLTGKISELNLELNRMQKLELENKQQLADISNNTDTHKQKVERLLIENADLQTKFDSLSSELKKERHLRKSNEDKLLSNEEELNELRANLQNTQKSLDERKRKSDQERSAFEAEIEELKRLHSNEINGLKDKISKLKQNATENQTEQIKLLESDLNNEWQDKMDKLTAQLEQKHQRQFNELMEEKNNLQKQIDESKEAVKNIKSSLTTAEQENENLKQVIEDLNVFKDKYERLQSQALVMKERYETRIKELLNAEPDSEVIAEEVKKLMNLIYKKLKAQIKPEEYYAGNGILTAMLKIIKMATLQVLQSNDDAAVQSDDADYFSQHIYKASEQVNQTKEFVKEESKPDIQQVESPISQQQPESNVNTIPSESSSTENSAKEPEPEQLPAQPDIIINNANQSESTSTDSSSLEPKTADRDDKLETSVTSSDPKNQDDVNSGKKTDDKVDMIDSNISESIQNNEDDDDDIQLITEDEHHNEDLINKIVTNTDNSEVEKDLNKNDDKEPQEDTVTNDKESLVKENENLFSNDNVTNQEKASSEVKVERKPFFLEDTSNLFSEEDETKPISNQLNLDQKVSENKETSKDDNFVNDALEKIKSQSLSLSKRLFDDSGDEYDY